MARLFYHRPRYAILDECTSGVTVDMEERFCSRVKALGCTCITISHRPALVRSIHAQGIQISVLGSLCPSRAGFACSVGNVHCLPSLGLPVY
jgi:ABC-type uncharacterized transport system fused permease/ATPase subunit